MRFSLFSKHTCYLLLCLIAILACLSGAGSRLLVGRETTTAEVAVVEVLDLEPADSTSNEISYAINNAVIFFCAVLVLFMQSAANIDATVSIAVTTTLAAAAGAIVATLISWVWLSKPDLSISLNGALGGLVGITAGCDCFSEWWSMVIGACAGALAVAGVRLLDRLRIDDPVGAWPVHGLCGIWGCLAIGFIPNSHLASGATNMWVQFIGTFAIVAWSLITMFALFGILKLFGILRVSAAEEHAGLDISEHGMSATWHVSSFCGIARSIWNVER